MKPVSLFQCEGCRTLYHTELKASECEARGYHPQLAVGDVVVTHAEFGWFTILDANGKLAGQRGVSVTEAEEAHELNPWVTPRGLMGQRGTWHGNVVTYGLFWMVAHVVPDEYRVPRGDLGDDRSASHTPRYLLASLGAWEVGPRPLTILGNKGFTKVPEETVPPRVRQMERKVLDLPKPYWRGT